MLKNDRWITDQAKAGMLEPFQKGLVRHLDPQGEKHPVLSFGCSSYGYDLRLSSKEFLIFRHVPGTVMNPKRFNPANLEKTDLQKDADGEYFILPAHSYGLGVALEKMKVPPNITVICLGKSTYARLGIIVTVAYMRTKVFANCYFSKVILVTQPIAIGRESININQKE